MFPNQSPVFRVNPLENTFHRGLGGSVVSIDSEGLFRPEHLTSGELAAEAAGQTQSLCFGQVGFAAAQLLFCFFAVVDIRHQVIPADNAAFGVTLRTTSYVEPTVHAIGSTATILNIKRLPGFDRVPIGVDHAMKVIRMNVVAGVPILQFLNRLAEIFQHLPVDEFDLARRTRGGNKPGNAVDDQAQALLIRPEGILGALPVVDVGQQHVPAGDTAARVSHGESARLEPPVHAIGTPLAELEKIRLPGFDRAPPRVDDARKVIRMDGVAGGPILQFIGRLAEIG